MRQFLLLVLSLALYGKCFATPPCGQMLQTDHVKEFANIEEQAKGADSVFALKELADRWIELGVEKRDEALDCRRLTDEKNRQKFWNISYSYRVLSDTLRLLAIPSSENRLEYVRSKVIERINYASENLLRK